MPARGAISGTTYNEAEIFDNYRYTAMRSEPLLSANDEIVIPVRNQTRPHFRRLGNPSFGARLGRDENDPTHDNCVNYLLDELTSSASIILSIYVFDAEGNHNRQVIFATLPGSTYRWFKEADARVAFHDGSFIQPDIGGRDVGKFFPRSSSPNILIEVVRTHAPDLETFKKLHELSLANTIVVFYFIASNKSSGKLNNIPVNENAFEIRISHYMLNGDVYRNDTLVYARDKSDIDAWYHQLSKSYFSVAKIKA
ncbi:hypothetical protein EKG40_03550 [Pseudomonas moorei]|nr:hypothetical protein EKG40_03550 [Pseudomonas moorei]